MTNKIIAQCKGCGKDFTFKYSRGCARLYCEPSCKPKKPKPTKICDIENCETLARSNIAKYCEKHYYRLRRNGTLFIDKTRKRTLCSHGYISIRVLKDHPIYLKTKRTAQYEHRVVFFDKHGYGIHECNWCKESVSWIDLHVDHVNECKDDNRVENLVASCAICNQQRNRRKRTPKIEYNGENLTLREWSKRMGLKISALRWRLKNWPKDRVFKDA